MKITIFVSLSIFAITQLFFLAEARKFSLTNEKEFIVVEQFLNELKLLLTYNIFDILKRVHRNLIYSIYPAADQAKALRLRKVNDACAEIKSLQQKLEFIAKVLTFGINYGNLEAQWDNIYNRFKRKMRSAQIVNAQKPLYHCN
ncbi:uncharacterized protein LOC142224093 [Haematobia irritans]|uniref:uncharacterized protein LOC142224093 n=1 Tax=Haematobia irritans TaxID=7368 RepID=UPI003F505B0A